MPDHQTKIKLEPEERILLMLYEHPIVLLAKILTWAAIVLIPFALEWFARSYFNAIDPTYLALWHLLRDTYLLFTLVGLFLILVLYHLNVHIVTNHRVIDLDQMSLTKHRSAETHINRIQDVSAEIKGLWGHLFNYGHVDVQSAADLAKIRFENVPDPKSVKRIILDALYIHPKSDVTKTENRGTVV